MTRIEKLRAGLPAGYGAALIENPYNRHYLTGFESSAGLLVVTQSSAVFIVDFRYIEAAKAGVFPDVECLLMDKANAQALEILRAEKIDGVYIEDSLSIAALGRMKETFEGIEIVADATLGKLVTDLRAVKEPGEIEAIRAAQAITDAAFTHILGFIRPGRTEREVAAELEHFMRVNGADGMAFSTICVSGAKSAMPHGVPDDKVIEAGDFLTMDYGALKDGYCSDMTRTVAVGFVRDEQRAVYDTVLRAQNAAMAAARAGMTGVELDKVARDLIYGAGYEGCFGHGLGHSLGLEIHEEPRASALCAETLQAGVIMTIEPGVYLEGRFGVRIENMVALTQDGCENLTHSPRELMVL